MKNKKELTAIRILNKSGFNSKNIVNNMGNFNNNFAINNKFIYNIPLIHGDCMGGTTPLLMTPLLTHNAKSGGNVDGPNQ